jgi:hypothetical protein
MYALSEGRLMLENGKYSAWFRTSLGEGTGVVVLKDSKITGGDTVIAYIGSCKQVGDEFNARHFDQETCAGAIVGIWNRQHRSNAYGTIHRHNGDVSGNITSPGMTFEATIIRISE